MTEILKFPLPESITKYQDFLETHIRQTTALILTPIEVKPGSKISASPSGSRIGGPAFVSDSWPWPIAPNGKPFLHLAQINLAEVPEREGYPTEGLLQFFIANDGDYGMNWDDYPGNLDSPKHRKVRYIPATDLQALDSNVRTEGGIETQADCIDGGYFEVNAKRFDQYMTIVDAEAEKIAEQHGVDFFDDIWEEYEELEVPKHIFGKGWAFFTQNDLRKDPAKYELLLQIDSTYSSDSVSIMWGDMGVANFFITANDLAELNFENVLYTWDCY